MISEEQKKINEEWKKEWQAEKKFRALSKRVIEDLQTILEITLQYHSLDFIEQYQQLMNKKIDDILLKKEKNG